VLRSRVIAGSALAVAIGFGAVVTVVKNSQDSSPEVDVGGASARPAAEKKRADKATNTTKPAPTTTTTTTVPHDPARSFDLKLVKEIRGAISPKSVIESGTGLVFAQNMMYRHTMTVYDRDGNLVKTIPDSVDLAQFGIAGHPGTSRGAPVEAAASPDGKYVYASNYSMYGNNFGPEGVDNCSGPGGLSRSFVYRINVESLAIDGVAEVGMVPKYVAVTPDNRYVLATNWCSFDMSVLDRATMKEVKRIPFNGRYPRGIVVDEQSKYAYVAVMGSYNVVRVDLASLQIVNTWGIGDSPRHVVLSKDGSRLYATLNGENHVVAVDTASGNVVKRISTGSQPRSMTISDDGQALYVVNYDSNTVSVLRASDLEVVDSFDVPSHPIGIAYERHAHRVWVACYSGEILVYDA
jgi:YVTN family beta-propeller protein